MLTSSAFLAAIGTVQGATEYKETTFSAVSASVTRTSATTKIDNGFAPAELATKNCGIGTCRNTNSWNVGLSAQSSINATLEVIFTYDLSGSEVAPGTIRNLTFSFGGCWHGGADQTCGNKSNVE